MEGGVRRIMGNGGARRASVLVGGVVAVYAVVLLVCSVALAASVLDYSLVSATVTAGDDVTVEGTVDPAAAGVEVTVALDDATVATTTTDAAGGFSATFEATVSGTVTASIVAEGVTGPALSLTVNGASGGDPDGGTLPTATGPFTIDYTVDPLEAWFNRELAVVGTISPAAADVGIVVAFDGVDVATTTTDVNGAFSATFVPDSAGTLTARVADGATGPEINVPWATSSIDYTLRSSSVLYGNDVFVDGTVSPGVAGTEVAVSCDGKDVATATTDASGAFTASFAAGSAGTVTAAPSLEPGDFYTRATRNFGIRRGQTAEFRYQVLYGPPEGETDDGVTAAVTLKVRDASGASRMTREFSGVPVNTTQNYSTRCWLAPGYYTYEIYAKLPDGTTQQRVGEGRMTVKYRDGRMPSGSAPSTSTVQPTSKVKARIVADDTTGPELPLTIKPKANIRFAGGYPFLWAKFTVAPNPSTYRGTVVIEIVRRNRVVGKKTFRMTKASQTFKVPVRALGYCRAYITLKSWNGLAERKFSKGFTLKTKTLKRGSRGLRVRGLVTQLRRLGFFTPGITNYYSYKVADAVLAFQKTYGLRRDFVFNSDDWSKLDRARKVTPRYRSPRLHIEISKRKQTLTVVKNGSPYRIIHVSTGATGNTPVGAHYIRWKAYSAPTPYGGLLYWDMEFYPSFAIHAYPIVPPWPASHGCVRVPRWIAPTLYRMTYVGERVYVYW